MDAQTTYNYKVVRQFTIMTVVWGIVGTAVGVLIAAQLVWLALNFDLPFLTYSCLRPLHTNAVIFAFGGARCSRPRCTSCSAPQARLISDALRRSCSGAGRSFIVLAAPTLPLGITRQGVRRAEWPIDILIAVVWGPTRSCSSHIYVANWFYGAFILTVAVLHIVNSAAMPVSLTKSYRSIPRRCDGAVVVRPQRGGLLPDRRLPGDDVLLRAEAGRSPGLFVPPVGRALLGADLHLHLGGSAPPALHRAADWAQTLGMVFSVMLLPVLGRHDQRPHDAVGRLGQNCAPTRSCIFLVIVRIAVVLRHVDLRRADDVDQSGQRAVALHRLDHRPRAPGALGWVALVDRLGYHLIPPLLTAGSTAPAAEVHFWTATIGIVLYIASMWVAGVMQGLMWRAVDDLGTLTYKLRRTRAGMYPCHLTVRFLGGLSVRRRGMLVMATQERLATPGDEQPVPRSAPPAASERAPIMSRTMPTVGKTREGRTQHRPDARLVPLGRHRRSSSRSPAVLLKRHDRAGRRPKPVPPLELAGRDIYIREGLLHLPLADDPFRAERPNAAATTRWPASSSTTTRSRGAPSAPGRIWRASARQEDATLRMVSVPYTDADIQVRRRLQGKTEIEALIAYLQNLGTVISNKGGARGLS